MSLLLLFLCFGVLKALPASDTTCLGSSPDVPVTEEVKAVINDGERAFAVNVIKSIFDDFNKLEDGKISKNIFLSPSSIYQTLMLAYMGAQGQTERELTEVMGLKYKDKDIEREDVVKNYVFEREFQQIRDQSPDLGYSLANANKFYFDRALPLDQCLQLVLKDDLEALDFARAEKARQVINNWVGEKTKKKINDLLPEGALDGGSKVAMVNAAYFKGEWEAKFDVSETKMDNFYVTRNKTSKTKFMSRKGQYNYYTSEELRAHVLEMPYVGDDVSMVVILPPFEDTGLFETVERLTPETLKGVMAEVRSGFYQVDDLTVKLPRFRIEQRFELVPTLTKLGLESLFDPSSSDLRGFLQEDTSEDVSIQSAIHKSFIEVNEEGSEAAAATALFGFRSARPLFHTEFKANHPFIFLIYDKPTDTILFFGVYQDPKL